MTKVRFSAHALYDRCERLTYIATTIGFGKEIAEIRLPNAVHVLTDTGVYIIKNKTGEEIVTMWIAKPTQIKKFYPDGKEDMRMVRQAMKYQRKGILEKQNESLS